MASPALADPRIEDAPPLLIVSAAVARREITILDLLDTLPWFRNAPDWTAWRAFLCAVYGLPMTGAEADIFRVCTGRREPPTKQATEVWVPTGRRGRKSAIGALIGVWTAIQDWSPYLAPGERAVIPMMAKNKDDAKTLRDYSVAILQCPALKGFLEEEPKVEEIHLRTRVDMRIRAVSLMAGRGRSIPLALLDEQAFWRSEDSAVPDKDVIDGIRPAMATMPGAMILGLSSPYARRGVLWERYKEHFGKDGPILVWQAPTLRMHDTPRLREVVRQAYEDDPESAAAEYGAEFRTDVTAFVPVELVDAAMERAQGLSSRPPLDGVTYWGFSDPSGGSSDSMTLGIAHWNGDRVVLDHAQEWPAPFDPYEVTSEQAEILKRYGLASVEGDKYAGEWVRAAFRKEGIVWRYSELTKSEIYLAFLPQLTGGGVDLLPNKRLKSQLIGLDRFTTRSGKDTVDHQPGAHDDLANVVAGACRLAKRRERNPEAVKPKPKNTLEEFQARVARMMEPPQPPSGNRSIYRRPR